MLILRWWRMVELVEGPIDIAGHGDVNVALVVVPIEIEATV
jgi:hypothetical protein